VASLPVLPRPPAGWLRFVMDSHVQRAAGVEAARLEAQAPCHPLRVLGGSRSQAGPGYEGKSSPRFGGWNDSVLQPSGPLVTFPSPSRALECYDSMYSVLLNNRPSFKSAESHGNTPKPPEVGTDRLCNWAPVSKTTWYKKCFALFCLSFFCFSLHGF
jgi:hypothetical protein